jgi:hypothetical protein
VTDETIEERETPASRRAPLVAGVIVLLVLVAIAVGGWWYFMGRTPAPDWERVPEIALRAPAGDGFLETTPWVTLVAAPLIPGEPNMLRISLGSLKGTPIPNMSADALVSEVTARPLSEPTARNLAVQPDPNARGAVIATDELDAPGWWRLDITLEGKDEAAVFYLLLPDPNLNGPAAIRGQDSQSEGEALYQRGLGALTSLQSVHYQQWLSDGLGNAAVADHAVTDGADGNPPGFTYEAAGGMEAVVINSTRWVKLSGDLGWTQQEGAMSVPPSDWGEEYAGATGFTLLGEEINGGIDTQVLSFVVPEVVEPRRQSAAWYVWWVDKATGNIIEEAMVSRVHYMHNTFSEFNGPLILTPPDASGQATPIAGTPIP